MLKTARRGRTGAEIKASGLTGTSAACAGSFGIFSGSIPWQALVVLQGAMGESEDMTRLVRSPVLGREEQWKAMSALLDKMGANDLTKKFLGVITANRRLFVLPGIIRSFLAELASRRGEVTADVVSAHPLNDSQIKALEASLKKALGGKVAIAPRVDPTILGGLIVKVGSRMIDSSLRTQLQKLKFAMKGAA
jgi:F-type H+-transporting ATPase subunit delta